MELRFSAIALGVLAIALCGLVSPAVGRATTITSVAMFSDPGEWVGGGKPHLFYPGNGQVSVGGNSHYLTISVSGGTNGDSFTLDFAAPPGQTLSRGVYDNAQRAPFATAGHPGIDISGDGRGCNQDAGRFEVKDIATDSTGAIQRLWIVYEQICEGSQSTQGGHSSLFGEVRIAEPAPDGPLVILPAVVRWPLLDFGATGTASPVTVFAPNGAQIGSVGVSGDNPGDFPVRSDECSGKTLPPGAACQVWVRFRPTTPGTRTAVLNIGEALGASHSVSLEGFDYGGRTRLIMQSDPGDYIGGGRSYSYTPANDSLVITGSRQHMSFAITGGNGDWWYLDFAPASGDILEPGRYPNATRYPFNGSGPGLSVDGNGAGCNTLTGEFTVTDARFWIDDTPRSFGATFEQHCEGAAPALRGTVEFRVGDETPPAPWMSPPPGGQTGAGGGGPTGRTGATPVGPAGPAGVTRPTTSAAAPGHPGEAAQLPKLEVAGTAQLSGTPGCTPGTRFSVRLRRPRDLKVRRVDLYVGTRHIATVPGSSHAPVALTSPTGAFRLTGVLHGIRGGKHVTVRETLTFGPCVHGVRQPAPRIRH